MNFNFEKLKPTSWAMILLSLSATLLPGCLFVFLFNPILFTELETVKVILLGLGLTLPLFLINSVIYVMWEGGLGESTDSNGFQTGVLAGSIFTLPVVYVPLLWKFFIGLSLKQGVLVLLGMEVIVFFLVLYLERPRNKV